MKKMKTTKSFTHRWKKEGKTGWEGLSENLGAAPHRLKYKIRIANKAPAIPFRWGSRTCQTTAFQGFEGSPSGWQDLFLPTPPVSKSIPTKDIFGVDKGPQSS